MRIGQFAVFLLVVLSVLCGWHYYLWLRLVRSPAWPSPWDKVGTVAIAALLLSIPLAMVGSRLLPRWATRPFATVVFTWFGFAFILLVAIALTDIALGLYRLYLAASHEPPIDPQRRLLISRGAAAIAGLTSAALAAVAVRSALGDTTIVTVPVALARLPRALSGFTIVQLTDLHLGPTLDQSFLESIVAKTNALHPDLVVITGDLVDGSVGELRDHVEPLRRLSSRHGVYFVTGNHEYYSGADAWIAELPRLGVRVLRNERVSIGQNGASFDLAGVDDASAHGFGKGHGANYARALGGLDPEREVVLLAHQPKQIMHAAPFGIGLMLSGHTHGGQIWPFGALVRLTEPYVAGLFRHDPKTQIYVSRGAGFWGPPMRLWEPAEITKIVLVAG